MLDRLLVFDLDGTLVDSRADIAASANHVRTEASLPPLPEEVVGRFIGHGMPRLVRGILETDDEGVVSRGMDRFRRHYRDHCLDRTILYPGVAETLEALSGRRMAVVSNKPKGFTDQILAGLGIDRHFALTLGGDSTRKRKPDPMPIRMVMEALAIAPAETLVIGDSDTDVLAGKAAGCRTCGVTYGIGDVQVLRESGPDHLIDRFADLAGVVR